MGRRHLDEIVEPTLGAAEIALIDLIEDTPAESLKAAAVKVTGVPRRSRP
jgi:hypothetical protein